MSLTNYIFAIDVEISSVRFENKFVLDTRESWSRIDVRGQGQGRMIGNSVVYKSMLYACFEIGQNSGEFKLAALHLDSKLSIDFYPFSTNIEVGLAPSRSTEEEYWSSLFLKENESDVQFKIQDKIIPAHKKILIQKSQFFSNLFRSGMIESKLQVIEIDDCEFDVFQGFLRFLYCSTVDKDFSKVKELFLLADKYIQKDLYDKCETLLISSLTPQNVSVLLDFAREYDLSYLKGWCVKIFEAYMEQNQIGWIQGLKRDKEIVDFVIENLPEIVMKFEIKKNLKLYEEFLIEQISTKNIVKFTHLFYEGTPFGKPPSPIFLNELANLRDALFKFVLKNSKSLERQRLSQGFSSCFIGEFEKYRSRIQEEKDSILVQDGQITEESESPNENTERTQSKAMKRMDPTSGGDAKEGPNLKKTKQSSGFL